MSCFSKYFDLRCLFGLAIPTASPINISTTPCHEKAYTSTVTSPAPSAMTRGRYTALGLRTVHTWAAYRAPEINFELWHLFQGETTLPTPLEVEEVAIDLAELEKVTEPIVPETEYPLVTKKRVDSVAHGAECLGTLPLVIDKSTIPTALRVEITLPVVAPLSFKGTAPLNSSKSKIPVPCRPKDTNKSAGLSLGKKLGLKSSLRRGPAKAKSVSFYDHNQPECWSGYQIHGVIPFIPGEPPNLRVRIDEVDLIQPAFDFVEDSGHVRRNGNWQPYLQVVEHTTHKGCSLLEARETPPEVNEEHIKLYIMEGQMAIRAQNKADKAEELAALASGWVPPSYDDEEGEDSD